VLDALQTSQLERPAAAGRRTGIGADYLIRRKTGRPAAHLPAAQRLLPTFRSLPLPPPP